MLATHLGGILAHCRYPLSTGFLEGMNNKIKVMKRMAYGYRDLDYFFLKLRAASPEIRDEPKILGPSRRRKAIEYVIAKYKVPERRACRILGQHRSTQRYQRTRPESDEPLLAAMRKIAKQHPVWGYEQVARRCRIPAKLPYTPSGACATRRFPGTIDGHQHLKSTAAKVDRKVHRL